MNQRQDGTNYYEILEIALDAPQHEIHRAYQRARATYSQDNPALYSMFSQEESKELLRLIEEAYSVLSNQLLRRTYDETLLKKISSLPPTSQASQASSGAEPTFSVPSMPPMPPPQSIQDEVTAIEVHQSLPDFEMPVAQPERPRQVVKAEPKPPLPPGMGRTALSTYKIDDAVESEIGAASEFDGSFLQRVRIYKNISLDSMSDATRISKAYLMSLETNEYKSLPAAVFTRGFVVQVARFLGLDETKTTASYMKRFKAGGGK